MRKMAVLLVGLMIVWGLSGCGKNSALEGKVVDGKGQPLAGIKVVAKQIQPIKGYEQFETTTGSDGGFRFGKLFPTSEYELIPFSETWVTEKRRIKVESGPEGQTKLLPQPMMLWYTVSKEGVIADSRTGLEWFVGPDQNANWHMAQNWTGRLSVAGGGWRMPTRAELKSLYEKGMGERNMDTRCSKRRGGGSGPVKLTIRRLRGPSISPTAGRSGAAAAPTASSGRLQCVPEDDSQSHFGDGEAGVLES